MAEPGYNIMRQTTEGSWKGVWVLLVESRFWILREITLSMGAMLASTVDMESASLLGLWLNCTYFQRAVGRILKCLVSVLTQNGEECSGRCFSFSVGCEKRTWKPGVSFMSPTRLSD